MVEFEGIINPPAGIKNFQDGVDTFRGRIIKEDRTNTDVLELSNMPETTEIQIGDDVEYKDESGTIIFTGIVQRTASAGTKKAIVFDHGAQGLQRNVNQVFTNVSPESIFETVTNDKTDLTFVSTISSGITLPFFDARNKKVWDIWQEMADILLANFRTDKNKNIQLELQADSVSSKDINTTDYVLEGNWKESKDSMVNSITVEADDIVQTKTENFAGPGTTFTLSEFPIDIQTATVGGTPKTGYIEGSSTGDYQLKKGTKQVVFDGSSSTVAIEYTYRIPINPTRKSKESIDKYTIHDKVIRLPYVVTRDEARNYAQFMIDRFSNPLKSSTWITKTKSDFDDFESYLPNQLINVNDDIFGVTGQFLIRKVIRESGGILKINVGDIEDDIFFYQKESQQRIKNLEEKSANTTISNPDELIENTVTATVTVSVEEYKKRSLGSCFYMSETDIANAHMSETDNGITMCEEGSLPAFSNLTDTGSAIISNYVINNAIGDVITTFSSTITHVATGDGTTAPATTDTALDNETYREAVNSTDERSFSIEFQIFQDTSENNGNDIDECGLFDAGAGGTMYARDLTNNIVKDANTEAFIGYKITFSIVQS